MASYSEGVFQFNKEKLIQLSINDKGKPVNLFNLYLDKQNTLWLGTQNSGVFTYNGQAFEKFKPTLN